MLGRRAIMLSAAGKAVLFTLFMIWWFGSAAPISIAMLALCGVFNGAAWYWLFTNGARWVIGGDHLDRSVR
jgi:hypothetical protein